MMDQIWYIMNVIKFHDTEGSFTLGGGNGNGKLIFFPS